MRRYKKILVGLNMTEKDEAIIRYAGKISQMAASERVYFIHIARDLNIPGEIYNQYPDLVEPMDEFAREEMERSIRKYFEGAPETEVVCEIAEGKVLDEILRLIQQKDIDLVLIGRRMLEESRGRLPEKIARKAPCSVLIYPEESGVRLNKLLVATDFSEHSAPAMDVAIAFAEAAGIKEIICLHAYEVPLGYYKTGKSYEEFAEIMLKNARENFQKFIRQFDLKGITVQPEFVLEKDTVKAIHEGAKKEQVDLILLGSRGKSASASVMLGSVTESLLWETDVPLLDAKPKGAGINLIDALLNQ